MSKIVQIQHDMNCYDTYDSNTYLNLFRFNMIWILTIHMIPKHRNWNRNMTKYYKIWANGKKKVSDNLDRFKQVEESKILSIMTLNFELCYN